MKEALNGKKILVTGGSGFLGKRVVQKLEQEYECQVKAPTHSEYDLTDPLDVKCLFALHCRRPDIVIHLAAVVGGIGANQKRPADFFYDNAIMGMTLMDDAYQFGVEKFVTVGTVCSYPKFCPTPFKEEDLWIGYPEETNAPYGMAKKMLLIQAQAYRQQYGFNSIHVIPANLYGPGDNYDPDSSHVIPALIKKCIDAKHTGADSISIWGDGTCTREFLYVEDAARAIIQATALYNGPEPVNIGTGRAISIVELANKIADICEFNGQFLWNHHKPNGQPKRQLDTTKAKAYFDFEHSVNLDEGLLYTINDYRAEMELEE